MSFPLPDDILQSPHIAFKQIMQEVQNNQNGAISRQMKAQGLNYQLNYGVTMPMLKKIASPFKKDNALAIQLWNSNIREGYLLAFLLFEPDNMEIQKVIKIAQVINNIELIEQGAINLFGHLSNLQEVVDTLIDGSVQQKTIALYTFGWGVKRNKLNESFQQSLINIMQHMLNEEEIMFIRGFVFAMQAVLLSTKTLKNQVFSLAEKMAYSSLPYAKQSGEEFIWLNKD